MGLYLCVFADDETDVELGGIEVGTYDDFEIFRAALREAATDDAAAYPTLLGHPDSDTVWTPAEARVLIEEAQRLWSRAEELPPHPHGPSSWQTDAMAVTGLVPSHLAESFVDVDGEILLTQIMFLAALAVEADRPVEFL